MRPAVCGIRDPLPHCRTTRGLPWIRHRLRTDRIHYHSSVVMQFVRVIASLVLFIQETVGSVEYLAQSGNHTYVYGCSQTQISTCAVKMFNFRWMKKQEILIKFKDRSTMQRQKKCLPMERKNQVDAGLPKQDSDKTPKLFENKLKQMRWQNAGLTFASATQASSTLRKRKSFAWLSQFGWLVHPQISAKRVLLISISVHGVYSGCLSLEGQDAFNSPVLTALSRPLHILAGRISDSKPAALLFLRVGGYKTRSGWTMVGKGKLFFPSPRIEMCKNPVRITVLFWDAEKMLRFFFHFWMQHVSRIK